MNAEEILKKHLEYGNPTSVQDHVEVDRYIFKRHVLKAMEEYTQSQLQQKDKEIEELKPYLSEVIELAEWSYNYSVKAGAHQEFLSENREAIRKVKRFLNSLTNPERG